MRFLRYRRDFLQSLQTGHGVWKTREGFIVRLDGPGGRSGFGEIAPLPGFGTETVQDAEKLLYSLAGQPSLAHHPEAYERFPATAFGLASALDMLTTNPIGTPPLPPIHITGLLPAGSAAIGVLASPASQARKRFKWKIGVLPAREEQDLLSTLLELLPPSALLRLDANGSLTADTYSAWLEFFKQRGSKAIEYLEQPRPPGREREILEALHDAGDPVPIALDESIAQPGGRAFLDPVQWAGPVVLKPSLMGNPSLWLPLLRQRDPASVTFSSAFESDLGLMAGAAYLIRQLGCDLGHAGIDTIHAFGDSLNTPAIGPMWQPPSSIDQRAGEIWQKLDQQ